MEAIKTRASEPFVPGCHTNQGTAKVVSKTITVETRERTDLVNLNAEIGSLVESSGITDGYVQVSSLHTTAGLLINEWQEALLGDIKAMLEKIVPREVYYRHNDPDLSDCDRHNADAHLRNVVVGHSLSLPIAQGRLVLGRWQSVILAEFDGPNRRQVFLQAFGIREEAAT
jgi:secondary thiamine-phosphate synthase enzyme